jgi:HPt (histidine-containing phosphotransfer) domain-containing protein
VTDQQPNADQEPITSKLVKEDPDMIDLVEEFVQELPHRLSSLQRAYQSQQIEEIRSLAHQLKGAGGGHGYPILTEKAANIEKQAIKGNIEAIQSGIEELVQVIARVTVQ